MPLPRYGVCIGTFQRDDPNQQGRWYHGRFNVLAAGDTYECTVDVATASTVRVEYLVLHNLARGLFTPVLELGEGYHDLARSSSSGALDYLRSPFLTSKGCLTIVTGLMKLLLKTTPWKESDGKNAVQVLEGEIPQSRRLFVFGEPYKTGLGMHNVHMNQGDPPLSPDGVDHQGDDGIWQDGGTVIERPDGSLHAVLTKFTSQSFETNDQGLPA
jgi:Uncharacterized conserved protein (DUF2278)